MKQMSVPRCDSVPIAKLTLKKLRERIYYQYILNFEMVIIK